MNIYKYFILIIIFINSSTVNGETSNDCKELNTFLKRPLDTKCCDGSSIECDSNGYFKILK
eukprot:jgi/Orpsp1_1/1182808/evm.model.c7180000082742.1